MLTYADVCVQLFRLRCPLDACSHKPDKSALIETLMASCPVAVVSVPHSTASSTTSTSAAASSSSTACGGGVTVGSPLPLHLRPATSSASNDYAASSKAFTVSPDKMAAVAAVGSEHARRLPSSAAGSDAPGGASMPLLQTPPPTAAVLRRGGCHGLACRSSLPAP